MDIPLLSDIQLNEVTSELIADAMLLAKRVDGRRPLPSDIIQKIRKELLAEQVYSSNAIEGNTLTLRETTTILEAGGAVDVGRTRESAEAINLGMAIIEVQAMVGKPESWSSQDALTRVHKTLMTDVLDFGAGINW